MTTIYFVRHAESDIKIRDGAVRPLTEKGLGDRVFVTSYLHNKNIDVLLSSPYKRAVDTIADFAEKRNLTIHTIDVFKERRLSGAWLADFKGFSEKQWADFNYKLSDGECLAEVQNRNIAALTEVLKQYNGKNIVIGTHGTALSTIINYYDNSYGYDDFMQMVNIMPWVVKMNFDGEQCIGIEKIDILDRFPKVIHILGAAGSGTTTLGRTISERFGHAHLDTDDYFWMPTDPMYTIKREPEERQRLLACDIAKALKCVISGSLCGWGDIFIPKFELVISVDTPTNIRIKRLKEREYHYFGSRILPGGDMYDDHIEFIEWAKRYDTAGQEQRSRVMHIEWLRNMPCPIIEIDGTKPLDELIEQIGEKVYG